MTSNPEDKIEDLQPDTDAADDVRGGPAGGSISSNPRPSGGSGGGSGPPPGQSGGGGGSPSGGGAGRS